MTTTPQILEQARNYLYGDGQLPDNDADFMKAAMEALLLVTAPVEGLIKTANAGRSASTTYEDKQDAVFAAAILGFLECQGSVGMTWSADDSGQDLRSEAYDVARALGQRLLGDK